VVGVLDQPDAGKLAESGALNHRLHQTAPDPGVLGRRIDGDRPHARNRRAFVEKIATENSAILPGHNSVEAGMGNQN
jgi:hypothetical protein